MAGTKVNNYSNIDTNIQALQLTTDKVFKGLHQLTLTEMDTTTVPAIAAGSVVECNGTLIKYDTEEAIVATDPHTSATVADGAVYIVIKGADLTAYFTATAPTWSDAKQGYYGLTTWANDRYVGGGVKASSSYTYKIKIIDSISWKTNCRMTHSNPSGSGDNVDIKINFTNIYNDIFNELSLSTYRFTCKRGGRYLIIQHSGTSTANANKYLILYKNGIKFHDGTQVTNSINTTITENIAIDLIPNDYLEFYFYRYNGTTLFYWEANIIQVM